jgi:ssDNA-binding Zn-finger/Zn-ribbon topoisomerase 1
MKKIALIIAGLALSFLACNKADQSKANISGNLAESAEKILSESGGEGCLIAYQARACELIDKATVAQILGVDAANMEVGDTFKKLHKMGKKKDQPYKGSQYAKCEYTWKDKNQKIKEYVEQLGRELEVSMYANVQIGSFAPRQSVASFKQFYRNVSEAEMNKTMQKAGEKMETSGKYSKEQIGMATDLGKGLAAGRTVTYLDNLGEAAASIRSRINGEQTEVIVFFKGNEFQVSVKMAGKTFDQNMEYTRKIAQEVLKKCK